MEGTREKHLTREADRQILPDGTYFAHSFNYQRATVHFYLFGIAVARRTGMSVPKPWLGAINRSIDVLHQMQNPMDGALPNYGSNDGSQPMQLSESTYDDYRPVIASGLQATGKAPCYEGGVWDEERFWIFGDERSVPNVWPRASASFNSRGYHVLRGQDERDFVFFRCGTIHERFGQADMLHADIWWRGHNVLVDAGTYLYNGPADWLEYFVRSGSHNTLTVDGHDQMLHYRKFKLLYWTKAALLRFQAGSETSIVAGEHYGFKRHPGRAVHRRTILFVKNELSVIVDQVTGEGTHDLRLQWLGGDFPHRQADDGSLVLETPAGAYHVVVRDGNGDPVRTDIVRGQEQPPRGWLSRRYGQKVPVPSLAASVSAALPHTFVTVATGGEPQIRVDGDRWEVRAGDHQVTFRIGPSIEVLP